jgi:GNAT superfamily N-acetyltransferase
MWLMVPQDGSAELCDYLVTALEEKMAHFPINRAIGPINTSYPTLIAALTAHGFQCSMKDVDTTLDVSAFDPAPFAADEQRLADEGIRVFSLPQLMESDSDWEQNLYDVQAIVRRDHPRPGGIVATTIAIEEWRKSTFVSTMRPALWMIAVAADGEYVGVSNLHIEDPAGKVAHNGLTGVLRAYRRRGVARAIKVNLIKAARREGIEKIHTGNEEQNPMLLLNLQLGFQIRPGFSWQQWEKRW